MKLPENKKQLVVYVVIGIIVLGMLFFLATLVLGGAAYYFLYDSDGEGMTTEELNTPLTGSKSTTTSMTPTTSTSISRQEPTTILVSTSIPLASTTSIKKTTTSITLPIECNGSEDCPPTRVEYFCKDDNVWKKSTVFYCVDKGIPESKCKSRQNQRVEDYCQDDEVCVGGNLECQPEI
ncbi:hypothetical protein ACFLRC_02625 [Candidatus Altiarchaeota archaeon]